MKLVHTFQYRAEQLPHEKHVASDFFIFAVRVIFETPKIRYHCSFLWTLNSYKLNLFNKIFLEQKQQLYLLVCQWFLTSKQYKRDLLSPLWEA